MQFLCFIKIYFNTLFIISYIQHFKKKKELLLFDQGLFQVIWSIMFRDTTINEEFLNHFFCEVFKNFEIKSYLIIFVSTDFDTHYQWLRQRKSGYSPIEKCTSNELIYSNKITVHLTNHLKNNNFLKCNKNYKFINYHNTHKYDFNFFDKILSD